MKKAIVVGATSGIGRKLADLLSKDGYKVGITGRRLALLEEIKAENPEAYHISNFDLRKLDEIIPHLEKLVKELGGLDLLVISSGIGIFNKHLEFEHEQATIETNILGYTNIADWGFNYFKEQGAGHLVGISSVAGIRGNGAAPAYNASKAFQINYLEGLRQRIKKLKLPIIVTDIRPGFVDTGMAQGSGIFWMAEVEKTGKQILRAIEKKKSYAYVTKRWRLVAAILKVLPERLYMRMV